MGHTFYQCDGDHEGHCMFCDGGLGYCTECGGFEGTLPTECPTQLMTEDRKNEVYEGRADFKNGRWHFKAKLSLVKGVP